jgi:hypothetical protein
MRDNRGGARETSERCLMGLHWVDNLCRITLALLSVAAHRSMVDLEEDSR